MPKSDEKLDEIISLLADHNEKLEVLVNDVRDLKEFKDLSLENQDKVISMLEKLSVEQTAVSHRVIRHDDKN